MIDNKPLKLLLAAILSAGLLMSALSGCGGTASAPSEQTSTAESAEPAQTEPAQTEAAEPAESQTEAAGPAEAVTDAAEPVQTGRQDGERFEAVITLEGMEETVHYEHIQNAALGFAMDYDYELFRRSSEADRECFVSVYDDAERPENYLEVTCRTEDAETAAADIGETLSGEYSIHPESCTLSQAGECIRIDASADRNGQGTPDQLQMVYIIPAGDGCRVATAHYGFESAEGFGRRFHAMMDTFSVTDRNAGDRMSDEQALSAIERYCYAANPDLEGIVNAGEYPVGWEIESSDDTQIVVLFRSYTGAMVRYYIAPLTGETRVTEFVPGVTSEEQETQEHFNAWDYLA